MRGPTRGVRALVVTCLAALAALAALAGPAAASQTEYDRAYEIGLEAFTFGLPLLVTDATFLTMTSIDVPNGSGFGPVNQFSNASGVNDPHSTAVVAPGSNGLSSIAWVDLRKEPQVLHVPRVLDHFFVLGLVNPYTTNVRNLGSVHHTAPGDYVILGPGQYELPIPAGVRRIEVRYSRLWIVGSTELRGTWDLDAVHRIQSQYTLTPLSAYGTDYHPKRPAHPTKKVVQHGVPKGLRFFDRLGRLLERFPPRPADRAALRRFATVGIGPGMRPSSDRRLSADTLDGLRAAVADGSPKLEADEAAVYREEARHHNGYLLGGFGRYGTDYRLRAVVSQIGLGAFTSDQTIFALSSFDRAGQPLDGSGSYVVHLPRRMPVVEGWSITVYDLQGRLVPNKAKRYQFSNRSRLTRNADGSADLYLQAGKPSDPAQARNWLPTTQAGQGFEIIWRLLAPAPGRIPGILDGSGWQPPSIEPAS